MASDTQTDYGIMQSQLTALASGESDPLANAANFVALIFDNLADLNWTGIYVLRGEQLVLGPFQGRPACVRIDIGQGVCGSAAQCRETLRLSDVHEFSGHIACDPASNSEIVVPLVSDDRLLGVLDIDSPSHARFTEDDQMGIEALCVTFVGIIEANAAGFI